jgi:lysozyme
MNTSTRGLKLIEYFEGFSPTPYWDGYGRVWTTGYGTTTYDVNPLPGYLTRAQAEQLLARRIARAYEPSVRALGIPLNQNQWDALVSLCYNCGGGVFGWQIGRDLRARRYGAAADDFMNYVTAGGRVLSGLVTRRRMERSLFLTPVSRPTPAPVRDPFWIHPRGVLPNGIDEHGLMVAVNGEFWHYKANRNVLKGFRRRQLQACRDRCWKIAVFEPPAYTRRRPRALWADSRHLGARWQALNTFMKRIDAIP